MAYPYGQGPPGGYGAPQYQQQQPPQQQRPGGYQAPGQPGYGGGAQPPGGYGAPGQPAYGGGAPAGFGAPPGMDPQVHQWFLSVDRDRSGKITALELQQALMNGNWSQFNPETCRLMISMFDRDMSGTIDMNEFSALWNYIQQWRSVFERFDGNRSGAIEAQELHSAFSQMGYNLTMNFVNMIVYRFDIQARRQLTLDNFIQACVMLKSLTDAFKQRDTAMSGTINLSYEDFMSLAVLNKP
ncbi:peflin-like [Haliotis rufescens]|uniref:peflin-like n=1 Tax=Haliotis rufescens TaxID=6454 RepID=UPI00201E873C|nr:peflin-like [Haliotis rufescens]